MLFNWLKYKPNPKKVSFYECPFRTFNRAKLFTLKGREFFALSRVVMLHVAVPRCFTPYGLVSKFLI